MKDFQNSKILVECTGSCLNLDKAISVHRNLVNLFIVYELDTWSRDLSKKLTLNNCFSEAVKLTKNANPSN